MKRSKSIANFDYNDFIIKENPYKGTGLEMVYANFMLNRNNSNFCGSPCLPGCKTLIKDPSNFRKHAKTKHQQDIIPFESNTNTTNKYDLICIFYNKLKFSYLVPMN